MTRAMLRRPALLPILALFLVTGIGVPVHHHADHHGHETHLTAGDHGHGATLVVRDMRTERPGATVDVPASPGMTPVPEPAATVRPLISRAPSTPRGRSPPPSVRPRAPPPSS